MRSLFRLTFHVTKICGKLCGQLPSSFTRYSQITMNIFISAGSSGSFKNIPSSRCVPNANVLPLINISQDFSVPSPTPFVCNTRIDKQPYNQLAQLSGFIIIYGSFMLRLPGSPWKHNYNCVFYRRSVWTLLQTGVCVSSDKLTDGHLIWTLVEHALVSGMKRLHCNAFF